MLRVILYGDVKLGLRVFSKQRNIQAVIGNIELSVVTVSVFDVH